jgi:DNA-binding MarR family transcriptional regulator
MSRAADSETLGLGGRDAAVLGPGGATKVRTFRLIVVLAQRLRTLMDEVLREDGLTTQQAALITVVESMGSPSLSQAAAVFGTTHQNARQVAAALERKGLLRIVADERDGRVRRLVATDRSRALWERRSGSDQQQVVDWFSALSESEAATLFELLLRLEGSLGGIARA